VIVQQLFEIQVPVFFDVLLHVGTLVVICIVFWKDIIELVKAVLRRDFKSEYGRLFIFILLGSIPTALIGIIFHEVLLSFFSNLLVVGIALIVTGTLLFFCERREGKKELTIQESLLIGLAQGLAIIPGISGLFEVKNFTWFEVEWLSVLVGVAVSGIVGYFSLKVLIRFVKEKRLRWFSWYCWIVGIGFIILMII